MELAEFNGRLLAANIARDSQSARACKAVLVEGISAYGAAKACAIAESTVSRALARMREVKAPNKCPHCGSKL